jgi:hypothetical protein
MTRITQMVQPACRALPAHLGRDGLRRVRVGAVDVRIGHGP